jgi:tRNA threonylcarbamoyladenosine biosynthesis protein TsaE
MKTITTHSAEETQSLGAKYAQDLWKTTKRYEALVVALQGELGSGKTTFAQGFAQGLHIKENVLSPTFVIIKEYKASEARKLYHIDCYRLKDSKDLLELGWQEIAQNPKNIILLEWPEYVKDILPEDTFWLEFSSGDGEERTITVRHEKP